MDNEYIPQGEQLPEIAYYYPNPYWHDSDWAKNIILFFDGIALLIPEYMADYYGSDDLPVIEGMNEENLLHVLRPETLVDKSVAEQLTQILDESIRSGVFDSLKNDESAFGSISWSRLGWRGDHELAQIIVDDLKAKGLARDSEDGMSVPIHSQVRSTILILLSQLLKDKGPSLGFQLSPTTDQPRVVEALSEFLNSPQLPTSGHVVSFDLKQVGIDLGSVPIDEVLSFRKENHGDYKTYLHSIKQFTAELSSKDEGERQLAFQERQKTLDELGAALLESARKAWKKPASFMLGLTGTAAGVASSAIGFQSGNTTVATAGMLATAGGLSRMLGIVTGGVSREKQPALGPFSYLFKAKKSFPYV
jgi:hypothetical protein